MSRVGSYPRVYGYYFSVAVYPTRSVAVVVFAWDPHRLFLFSNVPRLVRVRAFVFVSFLRLVKAVGGEHRFKMLRNRAFSLGSFSNVFGASFCVSNFYFYGHQILCYCRRGACRGGGSTFSFPVLPSFTSFFFISYFSFSYDTCVSFSNFYFFFSFPRGFFFLTFFLFFRSRRVPGERLRSL